MFASGKAGWMNTYNRGVITTADFEIADLTLDGTYQELDLSSIVPANTGFVLVSIEVVNAQVSKMFVLAESDQTNWLGEHRLMIHFTNQQMNARVWFALGTDLKLRYKATQFGWATVNLTVMQWKK